MALRSRRQKGLRMSSILVSGLINIETTLRVEAFPLDYAPVRYPFFGVSSSVSGTGYNIARALTVLGNEVAFLSIIGDDLAGEQIRRLLAHDGIDDKLVLNAMPATAQSVIIYDEQGKRQIHTDLKDIQERTFPSQAFAQTLAQSTLAVLCNTNYNRPFLEQARKVGVPVATDVHAIGDTGDAYNADFMAAADILFMSDERLPVPAEAFARRLQERYGAAIIVIGLGQEGALLAVRGDNFLERVPAVQTRPVINSIGAGDALFSSFVHSFTQTGDPYSAISKAVVFASFKIGAKGAAEGFLNAGELDNLCRSLGRNN